MVYRYKNNFFRIKLIKKLHAIKLGIKFVKFQKNNSYYTGIGMAPFEAIYGSKAKLGLTSSNLPPELLSTLETEENLMQVLKETNLKEFENFFKKKNLRTSR